MIPLHAHNTTKETRREFRIRRLALSVSRRILKLKKQYLNVLGEV
jgi:hypothetical protein